METETNQKKGRGRPRRYSFDLNLGELREYPEAPNAQSLINAAYAYSKSRKLGWFFRSVEIHKENSLGEVSRVPHLIRIK